MAHQAYAQSEWTWRNPLPQGNDLNQTVWTGAQYVAVGNLGTVLTSGDGVTWTGRMSGTLANLNSVAWTGKMLIAVGDSGTLITSMDGIGWAQPQYTGIPDKMTRVASTGNAMLALGRVRSGDGGDLFRSTDGVQWTHRIFPAAMPGDIFTNATTFIAPPELFSRDGIDWEMLQFPAPNWPPVGRFNTGLWCDTQFVAIAQSRFDSGGVKNILLTSPDGSEWKTAEAIFVGDKSIPATVYFPIVTSMAWSGNRFVALGGDSLQ